MAENERFCQILLQKTRKSLVSNSCNLPLQNEDGWNLLLCDGDPSTFLFKFKSVALLKLLSTLLFLLMVIYFIFNVILYYLRTVSQF